MENIRLELNFIDIDRRKERWNIYFVIATENPDDSNQMMVSVMPQEGYIPLRNPTDNYYSFQGKGKNSDGLFILERKMPFDYSIKTRIWMMHSRHTSRSMGNILSEIGGLMDNKTATKLVSNLGNINPWIVVSKVGLGLVGSALKKIKDRQLGWINLDQHFNPDGEEDPEMVDEKKLSTGYGSIGWSWVIS